MGIKNTIFVFVQSQHVSKTNSFKPTSKLTCLGHNHVLDKPIYVLSLNSPLKCQVRELLFSRESFYPAKPWGLISMSNYSNCWKVSQRILSLGLPTLLLNATCWVHCDGPIPGPKAEVRAAPHSLVLRNTRSLRSSQGQCSYNLPIMLSLQQPNPCRLKTNHLHPFTPTITDIYIQECIERHKIYM